MIEKIIEWSVNNRFLVLLATVAIVLGGIVAVSTTPLDAIPDLSDVQGIEINQEIIGVEKDLMKQAVSEEFDFTQFEDKRCEEVDKLIERVALGEDLPEIEKKAETKEKKADADKERLERLKTMLKDKSVESKAEA